VTRTLLFTLLALTAGTAHGAYAADATAPVREIMAEAENGWSETPVGEPRDYFDKERLGRIYSEDFARTYRDAARFPAFDDGDQPLDYDPIVSGQDSCALKDVKIKPAAPVGGRTDVTVTFDNVYCLNEVNGTEETKGAAARDPDNTTDMEEAPKREPAVLHFLVTEEKGRPVIDDILRSGQEGSLKGELAAIAAQGATGAKGTDGAQ
jgi:hypothetical protein